MSKTDYKNLLIDSEKLKQDSILKDKIQFEFNYAKENISNLNQEIDKLRNESNNKIDKSEFEKLKELNENNRLLLINKEDLINKMQNDLENALKSRTSFES